MKIPESTQQDITNTITSAFRDIYNQYLADYTKLDFETYIGSLLKQKLGLIEHELEITKSTIVAIERKCRATKRRWANKELTSEGEYHYEVEVVAKGMFEKFNNDVDKLKPLFNGCTSLQEYRTFLVNELTEWVENNDTFICQFRYAKAVHSRFFKMGLEADVEHVVLKTVWKQCPKGIQDALAELPHILSNIPIDFTGRKTISDENVVKRGQEQFFANTYYIDDDRALESLVNVQVLKRDVLKSVLRTLNGTDIDIFAYIMSLRDENMYATREIIVSIGDVVRNVFESESVKNYMAVKESLYRMAYLTSGVISKSLRGFTVNLFDDVEVYGIDGKEMARITVNIGIINAYVQDQTIKMYRHIIDQFEMEASRLLIFPLQRERIRCSVNQKEPGEPLVFNTNYNFFRGALYFSNKKKKENIKIIERTLSELMSLNIALKSYVRKGDMFSLEFYPITDRERRDLLNEKYVNSLIEVPYEQVELDL